MQNTTKILNDKGITLIEIVVVTAVIAILAFFAGPEMLNFGARAKMKTAARDLKSNLELAKMEAAKRNRAVYIVFTTGSCSAAYTNSGSYQVVIDSDRDGADSTDPRIPLLGASVTKNSATNTYTLPSGTALCSSDALASATSFRFNSRGFWQTANGGVPTKTAIFKVSSSYTNSANKHPYYTVGVSTAGSISIKYKEN